MQWSRDHAMMLNMEIERECRECGKRWMVAIPERGALPLYCSRACLAKAFRERKAQREAAHEAQMVEAIEAAIAHLEHRRTGAALRVLRKAQETIGGITERNPDD